MLGTESVSFMKRMTMSLLLEISGSFSENRKVQRSNVESNFFVLLWELSRLPTVVAVEGPPAAGENYINL